MPEKLGLSPEGITVLLRRWRDGDAEAESALYPIVLPELRRRASAMMRAERPGHTLQPTALIHEVWMRVKGSKPVDWRDRTHFFALAARIMRHILIDHARGHKATIAIPADDSPFLAAFHADSSKKQLAEDVDVALRELEHQNRSLCEIVEMKFFLGMTDEEVADALHLSVRTIQRRWREARKWLFQRLGAEAWQAGKTSGS